MQEMLGTVNRDIAITSLRNLDSNVLSLKYISLHP